MNWLVLGGWLLVAAATATAQQTLQAEKVTEPADPDVVLQRLERLSALHKEGGVSDLDLVRLRGLVTATRDAVLVTGRLDDVPLPVALEAIMAAAAKVDGRVSVVLSSADREALTSLKVSASFLRAREADAVRALLRLHESARDHDTAYLEYSEEGGVFVVRATRVEPDVREPTIELAPFEEQPVPLPAPSGPKAWLGVVWVDQNPRGPGAAGVRITTVIAGSPAANAGIQVGDVVLAFDEEPVVSGEELRSRILAHAPGDVVVLHVAREGAQRPVSIALGVAPGQ